MMRFRNRFQFSLKTLLWLTLVVAAFLGGMAVQRERDKPVRRGVVDEIEWMTLRDGTFWKRSPPYIEPQLPAPGTKWIKTKDGKLVRNPMYVDPEHLRLPYLPGWDGRSTE